MFLLLFFFILVFIAIIFLLLNTNVQLSKRSILYTDEKKNFFILMDNSNIDQIQTHKNISLKLNNKIYLLENITLKLVELNKFSLDFENIDLIEQIKENSIFNIEIIYEFKKLFHIFFNI